MAESLDFGFTTHVEPPVVKEKVNKLAEVEALILPLLNNLKETADQPYIHWPDRGPIVQDVIDKLLAITRE